MHRCESQQALNADHLLHYRYMKVFVKQDASAWPCFFDWSFVKKIVFPGKSGTGYRSDLRWLFFIFLISVFSFIPGTIRAENSSAIAIGEVTAIALNVRNAPLRHAAVSGIIKRGDRVKIHKMAGGIGGWLEVSFKGIKGYIRNRPIYIRAIKTNRTHARSDKTRSGQNRRKNKKKYNGHGTVSGLSLDSPERLKILRNRGAEDEEQNNKFDKHVVFVDKQTVSVGKPHQSNKVKTIQDKIITENRRIDNFTEREMNIIDGLNDIDQALSRMRRQVLSARKEMNKLDNEIAEALLKKKLLLCKINRDKIYADARLKSFYKMRMMGVTELFTMPDSVFDFIIQQNYLKRIIDSDMATIDREIKEINAFTLLSKQLAKKKQAKRTLNERLNDHIRVMKKASQRRKAILKEIRNKKNLGFAALTSLKQAANLLDIKMQAMRKIPLSRAKGLSFANYRGKLDMPVKGKIISKFGTERNSKYPSFTFQSGIDIKADRGEPVRSVFRGRVVFAQWLKGYGNIIIIDNGDNYYTLYAHVDEIFKKKGSFTDTGEVIATAGDTGSMKGTCLHFEVRFHGKPVNPLKWLKKG